MTEKSIKEVPTKKQAEMLRKLIIKETKNMTVEELNEYIWPRTTLKNAPTKPKP